MNTNIIARIANVTHIANKNTASSAKEQTTMSAFKTFVTRTAQTLGSLVLLSLATVATAKASVIVDDFTGPQDSYNQPSTGNSVPAGTTALQLKLQNTDTRDGATGTVQTYIYLDTDVNNGWTVRAMPSHTFSLAAGQSEWITIDIPNNSIQGQSLRGHHLYAKAIVDNNTYWLNDFLDAAFAMSATVVSDVHANDGTVTVKVAFKNVCNIESLAQSVAFSYMPWADGPALASPEQAAPQTLPALLPGQSYTLTFKTISLLNVSYSSIYGWFQIGTDLPLGSEEAPAIQF